MKFTAKDRSEAKHVGSTTRAKSPLSLCLRITSFALTLALAGGIALGMPLHSSDRGCNMPTEMPACEHMMPTAPGVETVQLCCLLDCQEPGSTGSPQVQIPSLNFVVVHQVAPRPTFVLAKSLPQPGWMQGSSFKPPDTYLKNLALLI